MAISLTHVTDYLLAQSWQIAVLVLLIAVINYLLRNKSAHIRYLLWLIVLAKCFVPPFYDVPLAILPAQEKAEPVVISPLVEMALPETQVADTTMPESSGLHSTPPEITPIPVVEGTYLKLTINQWLGIGWLVGACAFLVFNLLRALRANLWLWRYRKPLPTGLRKKIEKSFSASGIKNFPNVWIIEGFSQPFVWGLLRGSIYVPTNFLNINKQEHQKSVLGHELSHVLRFDAAVNIIQVLAQSIFWFHPLIWWTNRKIRQEREKCCDEMTIAQMETLPRDYSTAILETIEARNESIHQVPSLAVAGPVKNVEERIKTMLRPGKKFYKRPSVIAIVVLLLVAAFTIPIGCALTNRSENETATEQEEAHYATLFDAAQAGDLAEVKRFIDEGVDVNAKERGMWTPLMYAAMSGHKDVAELLISEGADVDNQSSDGDTALLLAVWEGDKDIINLLLSKGADINLTPGPDKIYPPPLHYAVWKEDLDTVRFLYDRGAKSDIKDFVGYTALRYAAAQGQKDMVELFLSEEFDKSGIHMAACAGDLTRVKELIEQGTEVDTKDEKGWTALFWAAGTGQTEVAEFLIDNGADISANDSLGRSLLYQAVQSDAIKLVEFLIDKGADINAKNIRGDASLTVYVIGATPLHLAAQVGYKDIVELLITKGADVNTKTEGRMNFLAGQTPLHLACQSGNKEIVELLIDNGADINVENNREQTPLDIARSQESSEITDLLIQHNAQKSLPDIVTSGDIEELRLRISQGADINATSGGVLNYSLLYLACQNENIETIEFLINSGADVNARTALDGIPLFLVCQSGNKEIVELLIDEGADVNVENINGRTPLGIAEEGGHSEIIEMLFQHGARKSMSEAVTSGDIEELRLRISQGADINATRGGFNPSLLHLACQNENIEIIELLINSGADINATTRYGQTPLDTAEEYGYTEIVELLVQNGAQKSSSTLLGAINSGDIEQVKLLISQGADVNAKNNRGQTLLHIACQRGNKEIAELLIDNGADIDAREESYDNLGATVLHRSAVIGRIEMVELLLEKGADIEAINANGQTPLSLNAGYGNNSIEIIELLLDKGADIETRTCTDQTPLQTAIVVGRKEVAEFLLSRGAKLDVTSKFFGTPAHEAMSVGNTDMARWSIEKGIDILPLHQAVYFGDIEQVKSLINEGANVNQKDNAEFTPLHFAVFSSNLEMIQLLLENGADVKAINTASSTPLFIACAEGYLDIVKLLVENGSDIHTRCWLKMGWGPKVFDNLTCLHKACDSGRNLEVVEYLLDKGADINAKCTCRIDNDMTPLHIAALSGRLDIVKVLLERGVDINAKSEKGYTPLLYAQAQNQTSIVQLLREHGAEE